MAELYHDLHCTSSLFDGQYYVMCNGMLQRYIITPMSKGNLFYLPSFILSSDTWSHSQGIMGHVMTLCAVTNEDYERDYQAIKDCEMAMQMEWWMGYWECISHLQMYWQFGSDNWFCMAPESEIYWTNITIKVTRGWAVRWVIATSHWLIVLILHF